MFFSVCCCDVFLGAQLLRGVCVGVWFFGLGCVWVCWLVEQVVTSCAVRLVVIWWLGLRKVES